MAIDAPTLDQLMNIQQSAYERQVAEENPKSGGFRLEALREAALGVGARGGLQYETRVINKALKSVARQLDTVYDFSPLMIKGRVTPPVLTETRELYSQGDNANLRLAGRSYKVESQARFSSRPPQWRDYIYVEYDDVKLPSPALLPRDSAEQEVWKKAVADGWKKGVAQADEIFDTNLNRLNRDYTGMVRYHILALKHMVTMPVVAEMTMPINASADVMNLDEKLLRITALPEFNGDIRAWSSLGNEMLYLRGQAADGRAADKKGEGR